MTSKTISLREDTYDRLRRARGEGESFSDVVDRLLRAEESGTHPLDELVGLLDDEEVERVREQSQTFRESVDARTGAGEES